MHCFKFWIYMFWISPKNEFYSKCHRSGRESYPISTTSLILQQKQILGLISLACRRDQLTNEWFAEMSQLWRNHANKTKKEDPYIQCDTEPESNQISCPNFTCISSCLPALPVSSNGWGSIKRNYRLICLISGVLSVPDSIGTILPVPTNRKTMHVSYRLLYGTQKHEFCERLGDFSNLSQ